MLDSGIKELPDFNAGLFADMPQEIYRKVPALANSDAVMIERNPGDYIWSRHAPTNFSKVMAKDIGSALHALLLEPEKYNDMVFVSSVKGRQTKTFEQEIIDNPDKIVLTQEEAEQVKIMAGSVFAHPAASKLLSAKVKTSAVYLLKINKLVQSLKFAQTRISLSKLVTFLISKKLMI